MIIVRIFGGLGNQMFQYALYYSMQAKGMDAYVDLSWYDRRNCHNGYELNRLFSLSPRIAPELEVRRLSENDNSIFWRAWHKYIRRKDTFYCRYGKDAIRYYPEVYDLNGKYVSGYWQSEKYFKEYIEDIRTIYSYSEFTDMENVNIASEIKNSESVSLHVRRGDYLNEPMFNGICDVKYYELAMQKIKHMVDSPVWFIFSNDISWCRKHFTQENVIFVDNNSGENSYRDMQLMSLCKHHIIANSSFSWWGAWLGEQQDAITIAPRRWIKEGQSSDIICHNWITI